jgi:hypothetical protein
MTRSHMQRAYSFPQHLSTFSVCRRLLCCHRGSHRNVLRSLPTTTVLPSWRPRGHYTCIIQRWTPSWQLQSHNTFATTCNAIVVATTEPPRGQPSTIFGESPSSMKLEQVPSLHRVYGASIIARRNARGRRHVSSLRLRNFLTLFAFSFFYNK